MFIYISTYLFITLIIYLLLLMIKHQLWNVNLQRSQDESPWCYCCIVVSGWYSAYYSRKRHARDNGIWSRWPLLRPNIYSTMWISYVTKILIRSKQSQVIRCTFCQLGHLNTDDNSMILMLREKNGISYDNHYRKWTLHDKTLILSQSQCNKEPLLHNSSSPWHIANASYFNTLNVFDQRRQ